ncbi:MAG: ComEC/Rec2 family competence protein [Thermodesulfobacteriota bacterium]
MDAWRTTVSSFLFSRDAYQRPVIPLLLVFAAGILCGEWIYLPPPLAVLLIGICLFGTAWSILRARAAAVVPLLLFFFLGWFCITGFSFPTFPDHHVSRFAGETSWDITGAILEEPVAGPERRHFVLQVHCLDSGRRQIPVVGRLRVTVFGAGGPELPCGALIRFRSRIRGVDNFKNPGGFDYKRFLSFQKIFDLAYTDGDKVEVLSSGRFSGLWPLVEMIRGKIAGEIEKSGAGPPVAILKALVIGRQTDISPDLREAFSRAGVAHLLAISGMQVAVVAGLVFFLLARGLAFIPALTWRGWVRKVAAAGTLPCVVAYGLLAGLSPSTQRATVMAVVFLAAILAGRRHQLMNTLALAALAILAAYPPALYSISFQLSFASVFFIVAGMNTMKDRLTVLPNKWVRRGTGFVLVSFLAIIGTTPLTAYHFNQVSWVGLLANCVMIPLVELVAVPLGLGGAALCGLAPDLSQMIFKAGGLLLRLGCFFTEKVASLPGAAFHTVTPSPFEIGCYYALVGAAGILLRQKPVPSAGPGQEETAPKKSMTRAALALTVIAAAGLIADIGWWINRRFLHDELRITVLDVGQGNAALAELPGGKCLLIDGGGFTGRSVFDTGKMIIAPFLWRHKIGTVDTLILTHPDTDHLSGLIYIADHFHVRTVWSGGEPADTDHYRQFMEIIREKGIEKFDLTRTGKARVINGVCFEFLYPPDDFMRRRQTQPWRNTNNNSLVTRISRGRISFLFPGDLMEEGERELTALAGGRLASTVLMAPHHGSKTSGTAFFLSRVNPEIVVISTGRQNRFGYPSADALKRYIATGADIYRTDLQGAVTMTTGGTDLAIATACGRPPDFFRSSLFITR